jgi:outer membrane protein W
MKKLVLLFIFGLTFLFANAQIKIGPEVGYNLTKWVGTFKDYNYKSGFYFGVKSIYYFRDNLLLQLGVLYSNEGWEDKVIVNNEEVTQKLLLNYLFIPIDIGIFTIGDRFGGLRFNFGIGYKYLLNYEHFNVINSEKEPQKLNVELRNFDISFRLGMDYKIDENLGLSALFYIGVVRVNATGTPEIKRMYNQGFKFGIYYLF